MKINNEQLLELPVFTESNQKIGTVEKFNIQIESQSLVEYIIKPDSFIKELIQGDLIITRGQVVDISLEKIIVQDTFSMENKYHKLHQVLKLKKEKTTAINKE